MTQQLTADRLYGVELRPQELALYGESVHFGLRMAPMFDDPEALLDEHFVLLVVEIHADVPASEDLGTADRHVQLARVGWEGEVKTSAPEKASALVLEPQLSLHLLEQIAETVNELARRAGLEAPLAPALIHDLHQQLCASGTAS